MSSTIDDKMNPVLEISLEDHGAPAELQLNGRLDVETGTRLLVMVDNLFMTGTHHMIVDLGHARVMRSALPTLRLCQQWARESGGGITWRGAPHWVDLIDDRVGRASRP